MKWKMRMPAGENARFARDAFDAQIGELVILGGQEHRLLAADVAPDGSFVVFTLESESAEDPQ